MSNNLLLSATKIRKRADMPLFFSEPVQIV